MGPTQSTDSLGAVSCQQSLYQCSGIGTDNIPAYGFTAPKANALGARRGRHGHDEPAPSDSGGGGAADAAAAGNCLQYCIPVQNSLAIKGTLHAKIGYCCSHGAARRARGAVPAPPRAALSRHRRVGPARRAGYNDFQGSIKELVPGMADIAIWEYQKGESQF